MMPIKLRGLLVIGTALIVACTPSRRDESGSTTDDDNSHGSVDAGPKHEIDPETPQKVDAFLTDYATALCDRYWNCCTTEERYSFGGPNRIGTSPQACPTKLRSLLDGSYGSIDAQRSWLDQKKADACVATLTTMTCADFSATSLWQESPDCIGAVTGRLDIDEGCSGLGQCASGLCVEVGWDGTAVTADGVCAAPAGENESCGHPGTAFGERCQETLRAAMTSGTACTCVPPRGAGESCVSSSECTTHSCEVGSRKCLEDRPYCDGK